MPKILVANLDNESMMGDQRSWTSQFYLGSSMLAMRHAWFAEPGDIVVLPRAISMGMRCYIAECLGYSSDAVTFLVPVTDPRYLGPLGPEHLLSREFLATLKEAMGKIVDWTVWPYLFDRVVSSLIVALGLESAAANPFLLEGGAELLNDKRVFRAIAAGHAIALAPGRVATSCDQLATALEDLMAATGSVIVKQDRHSSTDGNAIVTKTPGIAGLGASAVINAVGRTTSSVAEEVWLRLGYQDHASLVVESYYQVRNILYAEFYVDAAKSAVTLLNWGEPRMDPGHIGLILPPAVSPYKGARFISGATELARIACDLGFRGLIDVDGIVTTDGNVIYNEVNGRTGGCSHVHHICERLLGPGYGDNFVVATNNRIRACDFGVLLRILSENSIGFDRTAKRGIVVTAEDSTGCGALEVLSIGHTREEVLELERTLEAIAGCVPERAALPA